MYSTLFYKRIVIRFILILIVCFTIAFVNNYNEKWFSIVGLFILLSLLIAEFMRFIFMVGNNISNFIISLNNNDITIPTSNGKKNHINPRFIEYLNELKQKVSYIKREQIAQALFLDNLLENIEIGIIAILPDGSIKFKNSTALRLLNIKSLSTLETISKSHPEIYLVVKNIKPSEDRLLAVREKGELKKISFKSIKFRSKDEEIRLVFFQDIKNEIDESLLQSWQNLIRILTHEINNTVSPIVSLADSLTTYLSKDGNKTDPININSIDPQAIYRSLEGLNIIKERSSGLIDFVGKYKSLLPNKNLNISNLSVKMLFYRLKILFNEKLIPKQISLNSTVKPEDLTVYADQHYLEQVLINLVNNAFEAFEDSNPSSKPVIELISFKGEKGETIIQVIDNGKGIIKENLDKIFTPFYTTKEKGSGIGLSLSMQIIRLHGGSINVSSQEGEKTIFSIRI